MVEESKQKIVEKRIFDTRCLLAAKCFAATNDAMGLNPREATVAAMVFLEARLKPDMVIGKAEYNFKTGIKVTIEGSGTGGDVSGEQARSEESKGSPVLQPAREGANEQPAGEDRKTA